MVSPNLKRTQCAANEGLANKISFAIHLGAETCEVFEMDMIPAYFCPTLLCRPFIMRSDSELLILIFRSEKKMGLLMQSDCAKSDGIKSDLFRPLILRPDSELLILTFRSEKRWACSCSPILQNPTGKNRFENPMAHVVRFWPKIRRLDPSDYLVEK